MAFPVTPLGVTVELQNIVTAGVWTDVTSYVYTDNGIEITRGRSDEASGLEPSRCSLVFNNRDGRFSPRNPTGPYYGRLGRNTPVRVSVALGSVRLVCPLYEYAFAPDSAGLSVTGDIDLRFDGWLPTWAESFSNNLVNKSLTAGQRSYRFGVWSGGLVYITWSADGTNELTLSSTVPLPQTAGRQAVRATLDVDNGIGGRTARFYYAPTAAGPWVQLGAPAIDTGGITSIFNGTDQVRVDPPSNSGNGGTCYSAEIRNGIGGALVGNPIFSAQTSGVTSFADAQGNTWSCGAGALITNRRFRFHGEVASWPQSWDVSGKDVRAGVEAAGVMRRLIQGDPISAPYRRALLKSATLRAYWPMDDGVGSTSLGSEITGAPAMTFAGGPPSLAEDSTSFLCSDPLLTTGNATFTGYVPGYTSTGQGQVRFLARVPTGQATATLARVFFAGGTVTYADLIVGSTGTLEMALYSYVGGVVTLLGTTGVWAFNVLDRSLRYSIELQQNGANIDFGMVTLGPGESVGSAVGATAATQTLGTFAAVQFGPARTLASVTLGHASFEDTKTSIFDLAAVLDAYAGETAGRRIERLCGEEGIAFTAYGGLDQSVAMGAQRPLSIADLLAECESADMGQLFESRDQLGLAYRTRDSRQYQYNPLALAYGDLAELVPVEDDQSTRNDVTVTRSEGSSARATVDTGPLSTQAPPSGVGRYAESVEINLQSDSQLADQAQWRATTGTVDEARYPNIRVGLERPAFSSSATKTDAAVAADHGDLITVTGLPAWLPPDTVRQHTIGQSETIGVYELGISFVCVPATPAGATGLYDDGTTRWGLDGQTLGGSLTSTATGAVLSIVTPAGKPLMTTNAADFPMDIRIAGEVLTLSAISGAASPQTGTISARSVNGVVKAQTAGAAIDVADPDYYSL